MIYAVLGLLLAGGGAGALAFWYRHQRNDERQEQTRAERTSAAIQLELQLELAAWNEERARLEAVIRGLKLEQGRSERDVKPILEAAGESSDPRVRAAVDDFIARGLSPVPGGGGEPEAHRERPGVLAPRTAAPGEAGRGRQGQ